MLAGTLAQDLHLPAPGLREARIHPEQVAREKRGFVAAGAGADFEKDVAVVERIFRDQQALQLHLLGLEQRAQLAEFLLHGQLARGFGVAFERDESAIPADERPQPRVLHGQIAKSILARDDLGLGQQAPHFLEAFIELFELAPDGVLHCR